MQKVYLVRHAQSDLNVKEDAIRPLTEKGLRDSLKVYDILVDKEIKALYSSPFKRAIDTLAKLAESNNLKIELIEDFKEAKASSLWLEMEEFMEHKKKQWSNFNYKLEGGESLKEVQKRNINALNKIIKKHPNINIALGTHGISMSTIIDFFTKDFGFEGFSRMVNKTPHIAVLTFEKGEFLDIEEIEIG